MGVFSLVPKLAKPIGYFDQSCWMSKFGLAPSTFGHLILVVKVDQIHGHQFGDQNLGAWLGDATSQTI